MAAAPSTPHRRQRVDMADVAGLADRTGTAFGRLVTDHFAATPEDFLRLVAEPPHALLPLMSCLAHAHGWLRSRRFGNHRRTV